jgi:hypothetical protein
MREKSMKTLNKTEDELRPEYKRADFGEMVRGKYAQRLKSETNIVVLEPEIAAAFPTDEAVNNALRFLLSIVETSSHLIAPPKQAVHTD